MLIKVMTRPLSRPDLHQLIRYINEEREHFEGEKHFVIRYNTTGETAKQAAEDFKQNNALIPKRKGRQTGVTHIVLSWHVKEKHLLDDAKLFAFSQKLGDLMDFDKAVVFGRPHYDKENVHLHFAVSASEYGSGKSRRISKARLQEIQQEMNRFQQKEFSELKYSLLYLPELKKEKKKTLTNIPLPEKMKETDGAVRAKKRGEAGLLDSLRGRLLDIAKRYPKKEDFIRQVNAEADLSVYFYRNKPNGIFYSQTNKKYRFKRLAIDIEGLSRDVRLYDLENLKKKDRELSLEHDK